MKVLVISGTPWDDNNSFGNTYTNIFKDFDDLHFANVFCKLGTLNNSFDMTGFQITEKSLIKNLLNPKNPIGQIVYNQKTEGNKTADFKHYDTVRKLRWGIFFTLRELIWLIGRWKSKELTNFVKDFNPDIVFMPIYYATYLNRVAQHVCKIAKVPIIGYVSDDVYTLKQFSLSPFFWIKRILARPYIKKTIENCKILYVISEVQKREYEKIFTPVCKVLTKCADFSDERKPEFKEPDEVLKMVYAGNISKGRYEILVELAKATEKLNSDGKKFELDIYTLTPLSDKQKDKIETESVHLHPPVSYIEIREIQKNSDILLHVEGFSLKEKLAVHQSFSTKIVDYLETNRCIFAIGDDYCSSIQYFIENDCGVVATKKEEIETELLKLNKNRDLLKKYANNGWESGKKYHHKPIVQNMVSNDLSNLIEK